MVSGFQPGESLLRLVLGSLFTLPVVKMWPGVFLLISIVPGGPTILAMGGIASYLILWLATLVFFSIGWLIGVMLTKLLNNSRSEKPADVAATSDKAS